MYIENFKSLTISNSIKCYNLEEIIACVIVVNSEIVISPLFL
jgi:hypothetical protein